MGIIRNFDANKAKVQLKLSLNRLNLIQAKKNALNQNMRREIGQLLKAGTLSRWVAVWSNKTLLYPQKKRKVLA